MTLRQVFEGRHRRCGAGCQNRNGVTVNSKRMKLLTASVGTSALLGMGALSVATSAAQDDEEEPVTPGPVTTSEITTGESITETVAPEAPETTAATPPTTTPPSTVSTGELH